MLEHNRRMKQYLADNGIKATPKYMLKGSLAGLWRIYDLKQDWSLTLCEKFRALGFKGFDGAELNRYSGNGGYFSIFTRFNDKEVENELL